MPSQTVEIRHRLPDDDPQIVDLLNRRSVEGPPIDLNAYRDAVTVGSARLVAVSSGAIVGHVQVDPAWWTGNPDDIAVDLLVDHRRRGRGVGSELYRVLLETIVTPCRLL